MSSYILMGDQMMYHHSGADLKQKCIPKVCCSSDLHHQVSLETKSTQENTFCKSGRDVSERHEAASEIFVPALFYSDVSFSGFQAGSITRFWISSQAASPHNHLPYCKCKKSKWEVWFYMTSGVLSVYWLIQNEMILEDGIVAVCWVAQKGEKRKSLYHHIFPAFPLVFMTAKSTLYCSCNFNCACTRWGRPRKIQFQALEWMV